MPLIFRSFSLVENFWGERTVARPVLSPPAIGHRSDADDRTMHGQHGGVHCVVWFDYLLCMLRTCLVLEVLLIMR